MAKVNLLTIHWGNSYGGAMQTYATVKILQDLGHDVRVINLVHPNTKLKYKYTSKSSLMNVLKDVQFTLFKKRHIGHFSKKMYCLDDRKIPLSDYTIVGSDQVWNSDITGPLKLSYFLDFANQSVRLSLSSSFGKDIWEEKGDYTDIVKKELSKFKAVSVRENSGVRICQDVFGISAVQLPDPTLVCRNYEELIKDNRPINEIYPFLLKRTTATDSICDFVSQELQIPVYQQNRFRIFFCRSPKEWLRRMKNSKIIITDSFHGLAFSLIFHKQFFVLCADERKFTRLQSLLELVHLEERYVKSLEDLMSRKELIMKSVDYSVVNQILEIERSRYVGFVTSAMPK